MTTTTAETIPIEGIGETLKTTVGAPLPSRNVQTDYRPDAAELVLQLEQLPEGASEQLKEMHDFHLLAKEMKRVLSDHASGVISKYSARFQQAKELFQSIEPGLESRVSLAKTWSNKADTLAVIHYRELYVISNLRLAMERHIQNRAPLEQHLREAEQAVEAEIGKYREKDAENRDLEKQRGTFQRMKFELTTSLPEPAEANSSQTGDPVTSTNEELDLGHTPDDNSKELEDKEQDISQLDISIGCLNDLMREKKAELDTIRQEIERLTENKDAFAQEVTYNEHLIGTYQSKINTCFAVISQNLAQTPTLSKVHSYLQKDQEYLTGLASEVYQQANSLLDQHNRDCASENYAITSYLEADASQLTAAITAPNEEIAALQSEVSAIRFVASGLYEKEIDESKRQSVELKIQADLLALQDKPEVQGQTPSKELKKLAFLPMPNNVRETDPEYHGKLKSAYRMLSEVRHSAIDYRANYHTFYRTYYGADEKKHPSVLLKRLGLAVDANGRLIHQQTTDFRTSAHNIEAGLDNADSLLAETKPMQLTFERITEEYVSFCNHRGPRVQRLVEETKVNQDRTFDIKNDIVALESAIPEFYALIDELTSIASSIRVEAQRSASEVVMSQHTEAQAQLYRLAEAGDEAAMNELQMQQGEYGRSSFSRVELPPEHEEIVEQRKKAINDLEQAYKKLARDIIELEGADTIATLVIKDERLATELDRELQMRLSKRTAGLIPEEVKLREMLEATRLELRTEVDRYNGFAQASRPAIDEALETISDELSNSLKWFQTQGVQITIDKQALRETLTANSPVTPDAATTDWRPVVPAMNERKLLTKKLSTFLGKVSTRMMHLKIKGR